MNYSTKISVIGFTWICILAACIYSSPNPVYGQVSDACQRTDINGDCIDKLGAADSDNDGVVDAWDFCPDSTAESPTRLRPGRWAATESDDRGFLQFTTERKNSAKTSYRAQSTPQIRRTGGCTCFQIASQDGGKASKKAKRSGCSEKSLRRWSRQIGRILLSNPVRSADEVFGIFETEPTLEGLQNGINSVFQAPIPPSAFCCGTQFCHCYSGPDCIGLFLAPGLCGSEGARDTNSGRGFCEKLFDFVPCSEESCRCP